LMETIEVDGTAHKWTVVHSLTGNWT
jgi:hypothetical protein